MDVKVGLGSRGIGVEAVRQSAKNRKEWRALVHIKIIEFLVEIYAWFLCCLGPPSRALVAYYLERGGMPLQHVVGVNCENGTTTDIKEQVMNIWAKGFILDNCACTI